MTRSPRSTSSSAKPRSSKASETLNNACHLEAPEPTGPAFGRPDDRLREGLEGCTARLVAILRGSVFAPRTSGRRSLSSAAGPPSSAGAGERFREEHLSPIRRRVFQGAGLRHEADEGADAADLRI